MKTLRRLVLLKCQMIDAKTQSQREHYRSLYLELMFKLSDQERQYLGE